MSKIHHSIIWSRDQDIPITFLISYSYRYLACQPCYFGKLDSNNLTLCQIILNSVHRNLAQKFLANNTDIWNILDQWNHLPEIIQLRTYLPMNIIDNLHFSFKHCRKHFKDIRKTVYHREHIYRRI